MNEWERYQMDAKQRNTALVGAIIAGVLSLPMTWFTIHNAQPLNGFGGAFGGMFSSMMRGMTIDVTALNGSVTFLIKTPIWFIVLVAIASSILQLMQYSKSFAIPTWAPWATAILSAIWMTLPIAGVMFSGKVTPGIGWLLGLASAAIPFVCLILTSQGKQRSTSSDQAATPDSPPFFESRID